MKKLIEKFEKLGGSEALRRCPTDKRALLLFNEIIAKLMEME
jgi:hypothetical protein